MLDVQSASATSVGIRGFKSGTIALVERIEIKLDTTTMLLMIPEIIIIICNSYITGARNVWHRSTRVLCARGLRSINATHPKRAM